MLITPFWGPQSRDTSWTRIKWHLCQGPLRGHESAEAPIGNESVMTLFDWELQGLLQIILLLKVFLKKGWFEEIFYEWWMGTTQAQLDKHWTRYRGTNVCHQYWDRVTHIVSYFEPLYVVLRIMDLEVVPTMPFVYKLMQVMKENLIRQQVGDWIFKILKDSWEKTLKHSLHATST